MVLVSTDFDPEANGFRFSNRFPGGAVIAELARQDRLSELIGLQVPGVVRDLTDIASGEAFWGTFGLCGGMSSTALDYFDRGVEAPSTRSVPGRDSELFRELVARQADSLKGRTVLEQCLVWQLLPDRTPWWFFWSKGVGQLTVRNEWPRVRASIDAGAPVLLVLVRSRGVTSPADNHQVVAVGYDLDAGGLAATIRVYDPNHPGSSPTLPVDLRAQTVGPRQSTGESIRGFFVQ